MHEQEKIKEAEYFYGRMTAEVAQRDNFKCEFSAFLSAARSVLQYACKEAEAKPGGKKWYDAYLASSPVLQFFRTKRNINIHTEPIDPLMAISISVSDSISLSGSFSATVLREGKVVREIKPDPPAPQKPPIKKEAEPSIERRYIFADWSGSEDVFELARKYLSELRAVVEDGIAKGFLTP